jgi:hypothetical protein
MALPDLGAQIDWTELPEGVPAFSAGGDEEVGRVLRAEGGDTCERLIVEIDGEERVVEPQEVGTLHERGVVLTLDADAARSLPPAVGG